MTSGLILAAGESRRMETQKLLLAFGKGTLIEHVVQQAKRSRLAQVVVVLGHDAEEVTRVLKGYSGIKFVLNPRYREGMLSSVRFGLGAVPLATKGFMVILGDQPAISNALIDEMIRFFHREDKGIVVPVYEGRRGHPILVSTAYRKEVMTHYDDAGLRGIMAAHPDDVGEMPVTDSGVLTDVDTLADYKKALKALGNEEKL